METVVSDTTLWQGMRKKWAFFRLCDYVVNTVAHVPVFSYCESKRKFRIWNGSSEYEIEKFVNYDRFSESRRGLLASVTAVTVPKTFAEAIICPKWREVMRVEIEAHEKNKIWSTELLPYGKQMIECKCVFTIKYNARSIEMYKARLVTCGNQQEEGVDYK